MPSLRYRIASSRRQSGNAAGESRCPCGASPTWKRTSVRLLEKTTFVSKASAAALVAATLVYVAASASTDSRSHVSATSGFTITSTISSSATDQIPALLYPGAKRYLWYTAHNPFAVPITVLSMSIKTATAPTNCPLSNLDYSATTFTGELVVAAHGTNSVAVPISLVDTHTNQNSCQGALFNFTFTGTSRYSEPYSTSTIVTSSLNPSQVGQNVTFTATVAAYASSGQDPVPSSPTGTLTFKDGSAVICDNVPVVGNGATSSQAQCTPPPYLLPSTHPITADFSNTDGNFLASVSPVLVQTVLGLPTGCSGRSDNVITGSPSSPTIRGTNDGDFITAFGANYTINSRNGDDCIVVGDGNNAITAGNGDDVVDAGSGNNQMTLGNGDDHVTTGNGSSSIIIGNGDNTILMGNGSGNSIDLGNGSNTVTLGSGSSNSVKLGNGDNVVTIQGGSYDVVNSGYGLSEGDNRGSPHARDIIYLGAGAHNTFHGADHQDNVCHLPSPPVSWHGTAAAFYHDTIINCSVVTP